MPRWGRVGLSLTIQFMAVFVVLDTGNGFAGNYVHYSHDPHTSFAVQQQRRTVSGTVTDTNGEAVIGANVMEKGTTNSTVTDTDRRFSLTIESGDIFLISYIGYLGQEINTAGRTSFDIVLREDSRSLEKVVVVERNADANSYLNCWSNPVARWDNQTWGYRYIGQFQLMEEVFTSPIQYEKGNRTLGISL
ncbi:carboxypeptidase-like regulatory domain-containing protein [Proteiniphilum sp.]|uniref:carboxypeptidase-like regulatory domain-containing protein n=1 Tax=Proteiniphilum sp. TaxID=1926877 RepID=UPI00332108C1